MQEAQPQRIRKSSDIDGVKSKVVPAKESAEPAAASLPSS